MTFLINIILGKLAESPQKLVCKCMHAHLSFVIARRKVKFKGFALAREIIRCIVKEEEEG